MLINRVARQDGRRLADVPIEDIEHGARVPAVCSRRIWGMNFEHMPELKWACGHPMALAAIAGAAGVLFRRFERSGWL